RQSTPRWRQRWIARGSDAPDARHVVDGVDAVVNHLGIGEVLVDGEAGRDRYVLFGKPVEPNANRLAGRDRCDVDALTSGPALTGKQSGEDGLAREDRWGLA